MPACWRSRERAPEAEEAAAVVAAVVLRVVVKAVQTPQVGAARRQARRSLTQLAQWWCSQVRVRVTKWLFSI